MANIILGLEQLVPQVFDAIQQGAGQVYVTGLLWAPAYAMRQQYTSEAPPRIFPGRLKKEWTACVSVMEGAVGDVRGTIAFSPDGAFVAAPVLRGSGGNNIGLWSTITGGVPTQIIGDDTMPSALSVIFSQDGNTLATYYDDHTIRLWGIATGRLLHTLPAHPVDISSPHNKPTRDGRHPPAMPESPKPSPIPPQSTAPAMSGERIFDIPNLASGSSQDRDKLVQPISGSRMTFSPDNAHLISVGRDGAVHLWDASAGRLRRSWLSEETTCVAISHSGNMVATGSRNGTVSLWGIGDGELLNVTDASDAVSALAFRPGDDCILITTSEMLLIWIIKQGKLDQTTPVTPRPDGIVISPTCRLSAHWETSLESNSSETPTLIITDIQEQSIVGSMRHPGRVVAFGFSADETRMASVSELRALYIWNVVTIERLHRSSNSTQSEEGALALDFNGTHCVVDRSGKRWEIWDVAAHKVVAQTEHTPSIYELWIPPHGDRILTMSRQPVVTESDKNHTLTGFCPSCSDLSPSVSGDDKMQPRGSTSHPRQECSTTFELCVWDTTGPGLTCIYTTCLQNILALSINDSGTLISTISATNRTEGAHSISIIKADSGEHLLQFPMLTTEKLCSATMAISHDDKRLLICARDQRTETSVLCVFDIGTGAVIVSKEVGPCYRNCEVLCLPGGKMVHRDARSTAIYDLNTLAVVEDWPHVRDGLMQVQADGRPTFLEIRGAWLYQFDSNREWRLCWLPAQWRHFSGDRQIRRWTCGIIPMWECPTAIWKGAYLIIRESGGGVSVLDIASMRGKVESSPASRREDGDAASKKTP